jgi:cell division septation protein DedD
MGLVTIARARQAICAGTVAAALLAAGPALADVKAGVDAWGRGDYARAVSEWQGPAAAGDPDAMFNLGQAYRLGRGVPEDAEKAETFYARAAKAGHIRAADTYGLMLFQDGKREAALPYIEAAAKRGDPRSQYLLGIAHFNGDIVPKDWVRAYALLINANNQGLPQAAPALAQMDNYIPLEQRQQAAGLAVQMQQAADAYRGHTLASAELGTSEASQPPAAASPVPRPIAATAVSPSISAARAAVAEAAQATGTESPAQAGASYARPHDTPPPTQVAAVQPKPAPAPAPPSVRTTAPSPSIGSWRVQLGAFSVAGNADRLWSKLSGRSEIAGREKLLVPAGRVTKLLAAGYATRDEANAACRSLKRAGQDCLVTR